MNTERYHVSSRKARVLICYKSITNYYKIVTIWLIGGKPRCYSTAYICPRYTDTASTLPHRATERDAEPRRDSSRADTHGGQAEPERGTEDATGGTGEEWDTVSQGESRRGCAGGDLGAGHRWSGEAGADRAADGQSHAERPGQAQHQQRSTVPPQTQTGRREAQNAPQRQPRHHINMVMPPMAEPQSAENRAFHSPAKKSLKKIEKRG